MKTQESVPVPIYGDYSIVEKALAFLQHSLGVAGVALDQPRVVQDYLILSAKHDDREHFRILWLNSQHAVLSVEEHATGTLNQASVYPREVVRSALERGAAACILTHNHPSGTTEASQSDIALTRHLKQALALVDVKVLDHVITAGASASSMAAMGLI